MRAQMCGCSIFCANKCRKFFGNMGAGVSVNQFLVVDVLAHVCTSIPHFFSINFSLIFRILRQKNYFLKFKKKVGVWRKN